MNTPTISPLFNPHPGLEGTILPTGSPTCLSSSLGNVQLLGKPGQSFHSQVPRSLEAKERSEFELGGVRSRDSVILLVPGDAPQGGRAGQRRKPVEWSGGMGDGQTGRQQFSAARESRAGVQRLQRKQAGVSLNLRWLLSHSPLALGVSLSAPSLLGHSFKAWNKNRSQLPRRPRCPAAPSL